MSRDFSRFSDDGFIEVLVTYYHCGESSFAILRLKFNETATVSAFENPAFAIHKFVFDSAH